MRQEFSCGGVVIYENKILLLRKFNSDYVLPKGRIEKGESKKQTAIREVYEETGVRSDIIRYLGEIHYIFYSKPEEEKIHKTVFWYLMTTRCDKTKPQKEEGFSEAVFLEPELATKNLRFDDEREIMRRAIARIKTM